MATAALCVGIDVSKAALGVAVHPTGEQWQVANDSGGVRQLVKRLQKLAPVRIALEAGGGWELTAPAAMGSAGLPAVAVNPLQARNFGRATGHLAKTDGIDAVVLAQFATAVRPALRPVPDAAARELGALLARRRQLPRMRTAETNLIGWALPTNGSIQIYESTCGGSTSVYVDSIANCAIICARVRSGERRRICCAVYRVSARC